MSIKDLFPGLGSVETYEDGRIYYPRMGFLWIPEGSQPKLGSPTFDNETDADKSVRSPVRHLASYVKNKQDKIIYMHRTNLNSAMAIMNSGLEILSEDISSTATPSRDNELHALDILQNDHKATNSVVILEFPRGVNPKDLLNDELKIPIKYIKGYVNRETKKFVSNQHFDDPEPTRNPTTSPSPQTP